MESPSDTDAPAGTTSDDGGLKAANARNNARADEERARRWSSVRDAAWEVLQPLLADGARVAIVGAGNANDVPLARIAGRASRVDLVDFDPAAPRRAIDRQPPDLQARISIVEEDATEGVAETIVSAVRDGAEPPESLPFSHAPIGSGDYDLVIGDLLFSQLLYPGLAALGLPWAQTRPLLMRYDPMLTMSLVNRIHASLAPGGVAVHLHDWACWSTAYEQPATLDEVLADPFWNTHGLIRADSSDPQAAVVALGVPIAASHYWHWPFEDGKDFLVRATVVEQLTPPFE